MERKQLSLFTRTDQFPFLIQILINFNLRGQKRSLTFLPPANVVCEGYIFTGVCHSVNRGGGVHGFIWGEHAWFYLGVVRGFIWGACMVLFGGRAWFYSGGVHGFIWGGMRGFIWGGMHGFFSFFGYNEIRSMSGRYASYWNAFLYILVLKNKNFAFPRMRISATQKHKICY